MKTDFSISVHFIGLVQNALDGLLIIAWGCGQLHVVVFFFVFIKQADDNLATRVTNAIPSVSGSNKQAVTGFLIGGKFDELQSDQEVPYEKLSPLIAGAGGDSMDKHWFGAGFTPVWPHGKRDIWGTGKSKERRFGGLIWSRTPAKEVADISQTGTQSGVLKWKTYDFMFPGFSKPVLQ